MYQIAYIGRWETLPETATAICDHDTHHNQEDTQQKENHTPVSSAVAVGIPRTSGVAEPVPVADRPN
jgi:hypothetical protein